MRSAHGRCAHEGCARTTVTSRASFVNNEDAECCAQRCMHALKLGFGQECLIVGFSTFHSQSTHMGRSCAVKRQFPSKDLASTSVK